MDTGCSLENLPGAVNNWDEWRERERELGKSKLAAQFDDNDDWVSSN